MNIPSCDLLILPVCEPIPYEGSAGMTRIDDAAKLVRKGVVSKIGIIGYQGNGKNGKPDVYRRIFVQRYPDIADCIVFSQSLAHCSCRDILKAQKNIDQMLGFSTKKMRIWRTVGVLSYPAHTWRMAYSMQELGYNIVRFRSSEPDKITVADIILNSVTYFDPFWRCLGLPLLLIQIMRCRTWKAPALKSNDP